MMKHYNFNLLLLMFDFHASADISERVYVSVFRGGNER